MYRDNIVGEVTSLFEIGTKYRIIDFKKDILHQSEINCIDWNQEYKNEIIECLFIGKDNYLEIQIKSEFEMTGKEEIK